jgi:hypothetical protein
MNPIAIAALEREIDDLLRAYPELTEDETLRADVIEGQTDATKVLSTLVYRMQDAEMMASALAQRGNDLNARQAAFDRKGDAMRKLILRIMETSQIRKMPLPEATLSIRSVPPSVTITDASQLPEEFTVTKTETRPDRQKIKEALQEGREIPGAVLSNGSETLSVRSK